MQRGIGTIVWTKETIYTKLPTMCSLYIYYLVKYSLSSHEGVIIIHVYRRGNWGLEKLFPKSHSTSVGERGLNSAPTDSRFELLPPSHHWAPGMSALGTAVLLSRNLQVRRRNDLCWKGEKSKKPFRKQRKSCWHLEDEKDFTRWEMGGWEQSWRGKPIGARTRGRRHTQMIWDGYTLYAWLHQLCSSPLTLCS